MTEAEIQNLLLILRESFQQIFGEQFVAMLLFGSRARGDARTDSDIDILVILRDEFDYGRAIECTSELISTLSLENDVVLSTAFVTKQRFEEEQTPFLRNVRREGVPV